MKNIHLNLITEPTTEEEELMEEEKEKNKQHKQLQDQQDKQFTEPFTTWHNKLNTLEQQLQQHAKHIQNVAEANNGRTSTERIVINIDATFFQQPHPPRFITINFNN